MNIHIGKRGLVLLQFGCVWICYGLAIRTVPQSMSLPLYDFCPISWQGWAWVVTGAAAALLALTTRREWWGYVCLFPMPSLWTLGYLHGHFSTQHLPWFGALVWLLLTGVLLVISDWPEPPSRPDGGA